MKISEDLKEWIKDIALALLVSFLILQVVQPTIVREHSMEHTLHEDDYVFVNKLAYKTGEPQRGDIIVFRSSLKTVDGKEKQLVKRIIALPGDTIAIHDGAVVLNGTEIAENYTRDGYTATEMEEVTVPEGCLFVMGDNRQNSADSRSSAVGMVSLDTVVGKVGFRLFPIDSIGSVYK